MAASTSSNNTRPSVPTAVQMENDIINAAADDPIFNIFSSESHSKPLSSTNQSYEKPG